VECLYRSPGRELQCLGAALLLVNLADVRDDVCSRVRNRVTGVFASVFFALGSVNFNADGARSDDYGKLFWNFHREKSVRKVLGKIKLFCQMTNFLRKAGRGGEI
jgi:hypothetical protein